MALSACPNCHKIEFEIAESDTLSGGGYSTKVWFVQCSACGTVLGVIDYFNLTHRIREVEAKVDKILDKV
ncbi:MAG: hypothetical protein AB1500_11720 [Bacillota bacterium]